MRATGCLICQSFFPTAMAILIPLQLCLKLKIQALRYEHIHEHFNNNNYNNNSNNNNDNNNNLIIIVVANCHRKYSIDAAQQSRTKNILWHSLLPLYSPCVTLEHSLQPAGINCMLVLFLSLLVLLYFMDIEIAKELKESS